MSSAASVPRVAVATDAFFARHVSPPGHSERPERLLAAQQGFQASLAAGAAERLAGRSATPDELARAHLPEFIEHVAAARGKTGFLDPDTFYSPESLDVALRATGAALALTDALIDGRCDYGVGLWRPPGHHACSDRAMGFCLFNHVAVAARHAQRRGARRVLIVDWDVHHGNGTQQIFEADPSVLFVSIHQGPPQYPETGAATEIGHAEGRGYTVNVPLSVGAGNAVYAAVFERIIVPLVDQFAPDLTLVSAGFDAHYRDPLGGMSLDADGYAWMTRRLMRALGDTPGRRLGILLEGGYDRLALVDSVKRTVNALFAQELVGEPAGAVGARHAAELARVEAVQRAFWRLR